MSNKVKKRSIVCPYCFNVFTNDQVLYQCESVERTSDGDYRCGRETTSEYDDYWRGEMLLHRHIIPVSPKRSLFGLGGVNLDPVPFVKTVPVMTAQDMFEAVRDHLDDCDILIKSAAVADYRPAHVSDEKVKKAEGEMSIALERTRDILAYVGQHKRPDQLICGFSMETQNMLENSRKKLKKKNLDLIVANNLKEKGAGFGTPTNRVTLISADDETALPLMSKEEVSDRILDYILDLKK